MGIIAWLVLGAIAGYLAGLLVRGDEGLGVIGHIALGIVGALVGGFLAGALFGTNPMTEIDVTSIVVAVLGAGLAVVVWNAVTGRARTGRGRV
ncbi:MAG TPA: GlsB/YeaQ/YmgE family stress response membrane protein [Candidatus Limnocylindrales bacterium]